MRMCTGIFIFLGVFFCCCLTLSTTAGEADTSPVKIGVFDSRAVALAHWRSAEGMKQLNGLHEEMKKAKEANDEQRIAELEVEGPGLQVRLHQQVFSTGTVADIMRKIEAELPAVAKKTGVLLIASQWQIDYTDPAVELVDVTAELVALFKPGEKVLEMIKQMGAQEPVPIEELSMNPMD